MDAIQSHDWTQVKKVKFHHRVRRFYYKNLFRKIYTVVIIWLIWANVFSILKYSSLAEEPFINPIINTSSTDLDCDEWYEEYNWECVLIDWIYYWWNLIYEWDWGSEDDIISVVSWWTTVLNMRGDPVEYGDGVNTCGEWFHILSSDDVDWIIDGIDIESFDMIMWGLEIKNFLGLTSENSAEISYPVYDNYLHKFYFVNISLEMDFETEENHIVRWWWETDMQSDTLVMCATSLPVVTFVDADGYIVEQKALAAWTEIKLSWYEMEWLVMPNNNIVLNLPETCIDWYEKNALWRCKPRYDWYRWDVNYLNNLCSLNEESASDEGLFSGMSVYKAGNLLLNVKDDTVVYNNDMNACGEWYHILTFEDFQNFGLDTLDSECIYRIIIIGGSCFNCDDWKPNIPYFESTSDNSMNTRWYIYDENQNQFWRGAVELESDPETWDSLVWLYFVDSSSTIWSGEIVMCATYYPIATFLNNQWEIVEQKPIPAWTIVELTWYSIIWWITRMPIDNTEFLVEVVSQSNEEESTQPQQSEWSNYSGWWGWRKTSQSTDKQHWSADSYDIDKNKVQSQESDKQKIEPSINISEWQKVSEWKKTELDMEKYNSNYSLEQNQAYQFAYNNWITTKGSIQKANMNGKFTRIQMAKMLSYYAINVMWMEPDYSKGTKRFTDV